MESKYTKVHIFHHLQFLSLFLSYVVSKIVGFIFFDPRPFVVNDITPLIDHVADNGFPSSHPLITMVLASIVFAYNKNLGILLFLMALLVGIARLFALILNPIDIAGAIFIGIIVTAFVFSLITLHSLYNDDPLDPGTH